MRPLAAILSTWGFLKRFTLKQPPQWFVEYFGGGESPSGVVVGHQSAMKYTPFWAAVRIISGTVASLPFKIYRRLPNGGKEPISNHPIYTLLHDRPNEYMDWVTFAETRQAHVLCYGNGYAEIQRDGAGRPVALWPLLPDRTSRQIDEQGVPYYEVRMPAGETVRLADSNVLHIKGLGFDGFTGYDVVNYHKDAIGYGIAVKEYGARFYANNANPGGTLEHPTSLSDTARKHLKESIQANQQGLSQAHRFMLLEEGMKWNQIGVEPAKAQAIEAQKFTVDDCARIFQIPPHKLQSMEYSKYANVADLNMDFYCSAMLYWFRKWELEVGYKLLMPSERGSIFVEILVDALLRGNVEGRTAFYASGRQWGYLSINDIRAKENMNPIGPEGDVYLDPLNMTPAGTLKPPKAEATEDPIDPSDNVDAADGDDGPDDPVRAAHRDLLIAQCKRIITKQNRAFGDRPPKSDAIWHAHKQWARNLLLPCVAAYAGSRRVTGRSAEDVVDAVIRDWVNGAIQLVETDAEAIAEDLLERIGGNHAD
jgi:HK97 family phage portal protein